MTPFLFSAIFKRTLWYGRKAIGLSVYRFEAYSQRMTSGRAKLKSIKSSVLSRSLSITKTTISMGAKVASHAVGGIFSDLEKSERFKNLMTSQMGLLSRELGELKGSLMKAGQMLSMYGEYFLPPEANALLRNLQNQTPALEWQAIRKVLVDEFGEEKLATLEIDEEPIGTASLGQVHKARIKGTNTIISIKIQYPGVDKAVESDMSALKKLLSLSKMIPRDMPTDGLFAEVREMLKQEVDYRIERNLTNEFKKILADDPRFIVPSVYDEYSTQHVLTTSFEVGVPVLSDDVLKLSLERRNKLGASITDLYLQELFELGLIQTDPHFGNYLVRIDPVGDNDRLILLDFGATKRYEEEFLKSYRGMVAASVKQDREKIIENCMTLGFLAKGDSESLINQMVDLCLEICEPYFMLGQPWSNPKLMDAQGRYNWGESDLPARLAKKGTQVAFTAKFRPPPREIIFIDRKMTGLFVFLQKLRTHFNVRELMAKYIG